MRLFKLYNRLLNTILFALIIVVISFILNHGAFAENKTQTKIRYLTWETSYEQIAQIKKIITAFEQKNPDIKIQFEATSEAPRIFLIDAAAGTPPDVMYVTPEFLFKMVDKKTVLGLEELIERDKTDMSVFYPETITGLSFENRLYAYPIHFSTEALFYNKRMFDKAGIPYPDETWTWEKYREVARKMVVKTPDGQTTVFGSMLLDHMYLVASFGGKILTEDGKKINAYSPESIAALDYCNSLMGNGAPTTAQAMDTNDMQLFANEKLAMFTGRTWQVTQLLKRMKDIPWDVAPVPKGKIRAITLAAGGNCIARKSKNIEASWKFVKFYSSPEAQKLLGPQKNCVPALIELAQSKDFFMSAPPEHINVFFDYVKENYKILPESEWSNEFVTRVWYPEIDLMKADKDAHPPEKVLKEIDIKGNQFLENFRRDKEISGEVNPDADTTSFLMYFMGALMLLAVIILIFTARANKSYWEGYLFISPWLIGFIVFTFGPMLASLYLSFCRYDILTPPKWVGLGNIRQLIGDPLFARSLLNTLYYCLLTVPLSIFLSLLLAIMLNAKIRGRYTFRAIYYLPALTSGVAVSLLWRWIFNPDLGLFNSFFSFFGVKGPDWLSSTTWAMPAIIIMSVWGALGGPMLIYLAGLQGIPEYLYEAAEIDGAGKFKKFIHVTIPMLSPSIFFNLIMAIINSFQVFTAVFVMTANTAAQLEPGGPANSTLVYVLYLYQTGFRYLYMGKACAMAWILFIIILILTLINYHFSKKWVQYESV